MKIKHIIITLSAIALVAGAAWGPIVSRVEQPKYQILQKEDAIEIRDYPAMIVAETTSQGKRHTAIGDGFRRIAGYIFGGNKESKKIAMTAPVMQHPVDDAQDKKDSWTVRFIMPEQYELGALPQPLSQEVTLKKIPEERYAVICFSGLITENALAEKLAELKGYLERNKIKAGAREVYAFYNPPWTIPFLRRNEIMIKIGK